MSPLKLPRCALLCAFCKHKELTVLNSARLFFVPIQDRALRASRSPSPPPAGQWAPLREPSSRPEHQIPPPSRAGPGALPPAATPAPGRRLRGTAAGEVHRGWQRGFPRSWGRRVPRTFLALSLSVGLGRAARASAGCPRCCPRQDPREAQSHRSGASAERREARGFPRPAPREHVRGAPGTRGSATAWGTCPGKERTGRAAASFALSAQGNPRGTACSPGPLCPAPAPQQTRERMAPAPRCFNADGG